MERLRLCRICLVEYASMYVVVNRDMLALYEKLTNKQFVTGDRRPMLCNICCSRLKQCCRFQRKCLDAEKVYAKMLDENCELNSLINPDVLQFNNGLVKSPVEIISIHGVCQTDSHEVEEEFPREFEGQADIIAPKEELQFDEQESKNSDYSDLEEIPELQFDSEDDISLSEFKTEVEEEQETDWAPVAKTPKLQMERKNQEDVIQEEPKKNEEYSKNFETNAATSIPLFKEPLMYTKLQANNTLDISNSDIYTCLEKNTSNSNDDSEFKITNKSIDDDGVNLNKHILVHDIKHYKCNVCERVFSRKDNFVNHMRIHTDEKVYKCDICQQSFNQKRYLSTHILNHTGEKPFKCQVCEFRFNDRSALVRHFIRIHSTQKPYKCQVCQYTCNDKSDLICHIIHVHITGKLYKCRVCQRSFNEKFELTEHVRIHAVEKTYKCELCEYISRRKGDLTRHRMKHTGEKPFKCGECEYSCIRKSDLKRHMRIHTGEKPYKCNKCEYSGNQKSLLKSHIHHIHFRVKPNV